MKEASPLNPGEESMGPDGHVTTQRAVLAGLRAGQQKWRLRALRTAKLHCVYQRQICKAETDQEATQGRLLAETESLLVAAQDGVIQEGGCVLAFW